MLWQRLLALGGKQALGLEFGFQCLKGLAQCAVTGGLDAVDNQLIVATAFIQTDTAARADLLAVAHGQAHAGGILAKQRAADLRAVVLQCEVHMAGAGPRQVGQLALNPDTRKDIFQQLPGTGIQLADAEHVWLGGELLKQVVVVHWRILTGC